MRPEDIDQVSEIDKGAFPTQWPPTNYRHELRNRLAHYIVVYEEGDTAKEPPVETAATPAEREPTGLFSRLRRLFRRSPADEKPSPNRDKIIGFAGFWVMADESHITSIAVRESHRRRGIGELLLTAIFEHSIKLKARIITLEVRASNTSAQNLYAKHGFAHVGVRSGYYIDNREDALLMSTQYLQQAEFKEKLKQLKQAQLSKWGRDPYRSLG